MKTKILLLLFTCLIALCSHAGIVKQFSFQNCVIELLDSAGAAAATSHSDAYTKAFTPFDLQIRLGGKEKAKEQDYLKLAATQALTWDEGEQKKLQSSFQEIEKILNDNGIQLNLPKNIQMLKTAGAEEFEAEGYTRENRIMLCVKGGQQIDAHILAHELFHVYSRFNTETRDKIYAIFGFQKCNSINTNAAMNNRVITNPDCPVTEHFINLPWEKSSADFVLQLYSSKPFEGHFNLSDANVALLMVEGAANNKKPVLRKGEGVLVQLDAIPELFSKISQNTSYVLHPEEISAEHFALWAIGKEVPEPEFFDKMKVVLSEAK